MRKSFEFSLFGMACNRCVEKIEGLLRGQSYISSVNVWRSPDRVVIESDHDLTDEDINAIFRESNVTKYKASEVTPGNIHSQLVRFEKNESLGLV